MRRQAFDVLAIGGTMRDILCVLRAGEGRTTLDVAQKQLSFPLGGKVRARALHVALGGGAADAAVACARLGLHTGLVSVVGRDSVGDELIRELKKEHVETSFVPQVALEQTGVSVVLLEEASGEQSSVYTAGANRLLELTEDVQKTLHETKWVCVSALGDAWEDNQRVLVESLEREVAQLAFMPSAAEVCLGAEALAPLLQHVDALILTRAEAQEFSRAGTGTASDGLARALKARGPGMVILTDEARDVTIYTPGEKLTVAVPPLAVADTLGAGDAFAATVVAMLLLGGRDIIGAVRAAVVNASSVVSLRTAQQGLLTRSMLEERLRRSDIPVRRETFAG